MLRFVSSAVAGLSETLAPLVRSPIEQCQNGWTRAQSAIANITNHDDADSDSDPPYQQLISAVNQMTEAIKRDQSEQRNKSDKHSDTNSDSGANSDDHQYDHSAVIDLLSEQRVLSSLASTGLQPRPAGLRWICIKAIDALLSSTHSPIIRSPDVLDGLLDVLVDAIQSSESNAHARVNRPTIMSASRAVSVKIKEDTLTALTFRERLTMSESNARYFVDYLIAHVNHFSNDGVSSSQSLLDLVCSSSPSTLAEFVVDSTQYCSLLVSGLSELVAQLPPVSECPPFAQLWSSHTVAVLFLQRLDFIDRACTVAPPIVGAKIGRAFLHYFLDPAIASMLLDVREEVAAWTTLFLYHCCTHVTHHQLIRAIAVFILATDTSTIVSPATGLDTAPTSSGHANHALVRRTLIKRIDSLSEPLCQATMQLFTAIVQFRDLSIITALIGSLPTISTATSASDDPVSCLMPLLKIVGDVRRNTEYSDYLFDAQTEQMKWPLSSPPSLSLSSSTNTSTGDSELFLSTLLNKLDSLFENSLAINLRLTALVSALCSCPAPSVQSKLFHSSASQRSLVTVLTDLATAGRRRESRLSQFDKRLAAAKRRIHDSLTQSARARTTLSDEGLYIVEGANGRGSSLAGVEPLDVERFLAGRCILEAMTSEMAATKENQKRQQQITEIEAK